MNMFLYKLRKVKTIKANILNNVYAKVLGFIYFSNGFVSGLSLLNSLTNLYINICTFLHIATGLSFKIKL